MPTKLEDLLRRLFPQAVFDPGDETLGLGSFAEWDSLGHFNLLMLIEETFDTQFTVEELSELKMLKDIRANLAAKGIAA